MCSYNRACTAQSQGGSDNALRDAIQRCSYTGDDRISYRGGCVHGIGRHHDSGRRRRDGHRASDIKAAFFDIDGTLTSFVTHVIPQSPSTRCTSCRIAG